MKRGTTALGLILALNAAALSGTDAGQPLNIEGDSMTLIVVVGAPGEDHYGDEFARWADAWSDLAQRAGTALVEIGRGASADTTDLEELEGVLQDCVQTEGQELWLILIGHGTFDGRDARFNLRGPDLTAADLARWLENLRRPLVVVNCSAASAPYLNALSGPRRVIVTATKSGYEQDFARFGGYLAEALAHPDADLDKDGQVSLFEAFLAAARHTARFYETAGRLATEHALLDDNGDGQGTPADWFQGLRLVKRPGAGMEPDGARAHQVHLIRSASERFLSLEARARRDALEREIDDLRRRKADLDEATYYGQLERLLLDLARVYAGHPPEPGSRSLAPEHGDGPAVE